MYWARAEGKAGGGGGGVITLLSLRMHGEWTDFLMVFVFDVRVRGCAGGCVVVVCGREVPRGTVLRLLCMPLRPLSSPL